MASHLIDRLLRLLGLDAQAAVAPSPGRAVHRAGARAASGDPASTHAELTDRLLADRVLLLGTPIDDEVAAEVIAKLLFLAHRSATEPVNLYLNSPGGTVSAAVAVLETLRSLSAPVDTVCLGRADGVAALLLAAGRRGSRAAVPEATILLTRVEGSAAPPELVERTERAFLERLAEATGRPVAALRALTDAGAPLDTGEALRHGFIDGLVAHGGR